MMTCSIFDVFDYCEEWKIFYCDKRFVSEEANVRMKERFKRKQVEHWLKLFKKNQLTLYYLRSTTPLEWSLHNPLWWSCSMSTSVA